MTGEIERRIREVKGPRPLLSKTREAALTERQREILDELGAVFDEGFNHLTMADLAGRMGCSLRTLYGLAPSRDELVMLVVDRNLWRIGRAAMSAVDSEGPPLDALRSYLAAAHMAVANTTEPFALDCEGTTATRDLNRSHRNYLVQVTLALLDLAVERGDIAAVDTAAVARVLGSVGHDLAAPEAIATLRTTPKDAADEIVETILRGLPTP